MNDAPATIHQPLGIMVGFEIRLIPKMIHLQGDYFSGNANISGGIVNLVYYPLKNLQTYIGLDVPGPSSGNEFAGNVGFIFNSR